MRPRSGRLRVREVHPFAAARARTASKRCVRGSPPFSYTVGRAKRGASGMSSMRRLDPAAAHSRISAFSPVAIFA